MLLGGGSGGFENARCALTKTSARKKVDVLRRQNAMFKTYVFLRRNGSLAITFRFVVVENGHVLVFEQRSRKNVGRAGPRTRIQGFGRGNKSSAEIAVLHMFYS